jgi:hypothetical protein
MHANGPSATEDDDMVQRTSKVQATIGILVLLLAVAVTGASCHTHEQQQQLQPKCGAHCILLLQEDAQSSAC